MIKNGKDRRKRKKRRWFHGLSPRRRKLIENLLSGKFKTKKDALISAGYAESTALKSAKVTIGNNRNLTSMQLALEEMGINDLRLARSILEGLDSTKVISALILNRYGTEQAEASGITKDFVEVPDFHARHKFLETALSLRGDFPEKKIDATLTTETHEQRLIRLREKIGKQL